MRIFIIATFIFASCLLVGNAEEHQQAEDDWLQHYYERPSPERFETEVKKLQAMGILKKKSTIDPIAAFFSRLFVAADPSTLSRWLKFIDALPNADQAAFLVALRWADTPETINALRQRSSGNSALANRAKQLVDSRSPKLNKISHPAPGELDMCWGAFFATGDPVYALTVIRCAAQPPESDPIDMSHQAARWSLKSLCKSHPKLRAIKDDFYNAATSAERKSLDELFNK